MTLSSIIIYASSTSSPSSSDRCTIQPPPPNAKTGLQDEGREGGLAVAHTGKRLLAGHVRAASTNPEKKTASLRSISGQRFDNSGWSKGNAAPALYTALANLCPAGISPRPQHTTPTADGAPLPPMLPPQPGKGREGGWRLRVKPSSFVGGGGGRRASDRKSRGGWRSSCNRAGKRKRKFLLIFWEKQHIKVRISL